MSPEGLSLGQAIDDVKVGATDWKRRHVELLKQSYAGAPHVELMLELVNSVYSCEFTTIGELSKASLDVVGAVRDEQGRQVGRFRQTLQLPAGSGSTLAGKQVLYQTGLTLPPGRFSAKVVVRENATGKIGSFGSRRRAPLRRSTRPPTAR